ncbi:hypothetical protein AMATHDRAFT_69484 [Amanita thiersii Skay4041]|uniref:Zn(2)-C6 fungal-type domain-containing protein n=1 Tax=Amanita thiersii Skay4041 TaxID=703135 RepID=A0A2A9NEC3_9AGAR|nr:hypothetical protein AMATHDRAFT_69484 [Amanita thiersii Skay4041]
MANKATSDKTIQGTLQRGKACLRCRKRKMRCDGIKPACQQCIKSKKSDACEYDDGKGKTRTQLLREHIVRLERRIRELEDPDYVSSIVTLSDPHARSCSSPSSFESHESACQPSRSPLPSDSLFTPPWHELNTTPSPSSSPFVQFSGQLVGVQAPVELDHILLDIFVQHQHQCGLDIHIGHSQCHVGQLISKRRHSSLMNAMYLWACFISRPDPLSQHEEYFLEVALKEISDGLRTVDNILDVIQASCLISIYFLANARFLEGGYHASAAASLAVQCGLVSQATLFSSMFNDDKAGEVLDSKLVLSDTRVNEQVSTFWQVYNLDRCWSAILRKPNVLPDIEGSTFSPCLKSIDGYDLDQGSARLPPPTIKAFPYQDADYVTSTIQAWRAEASTLFASATQIADSCGDHKPSNIMHKIQAFEQRISQLGPALMNLDRLEDILADHRFSLVLIHTLTYTAMVQVYRPLLHEDGSSFEKCTYAARSCTAIVRSLSDQDFSFLDPIVGPCWSAIGDFLIQELDSMETTWPFMNTTNVRTELGTIFYALTCLALKFPLVAPSIARFRKRLFQTSPS